MGQKTVTFTSPGEPWDESVTTIGEENAELGLPADTPAGVTYRRPDKEGHIIVGALAQKKDDEGNLIELENDQETLNRIALWIEKRDGERLTEEYIKVLGVNAFRMVFEFGDEKNRQKGEQVHFTKDGLHYTLSILVPTQDYNSQIGHFRTLVESFSLASEK